ncbi:MAG: YybH family protein [Candidatus Thorarchaeota archaeon]
MDLESEKQLVAHVIDEWLEGWSQKDVDVILKHVSDDFVMQLPIQSWSNIIGREGLKEYVLEYYMKRPLGPVTHEESQIGVSGSGDLAYEVGRHDHVVFDDSDSSSIAPWNHLIVLKNIKGEWKIVAISETNVLSV